MIKDKSVLEVSDKICNECLFSNNKIVSDERKEELLNTCKKNGTYFICHKFTLDGRDVMCKGWFSRNPTYHLIQIAKTLKLLRFLKQPNE